MNEVHPYISEGFGEDFVPENYDMSVIDHFEQVTDKTAPSWQDAWQKRKEFSAGTVPAVVYKD
jgi:cysteine synthase